MKKPPTVEMLLSKTVSIYRISRKEKMASRPTTNSKSRGIDTPSIKYPFLAGGLTGIIEICVTYPFEYVKTQQQFTPSAQAQAQGRPVFRSPLHVYSYTVKHHGFRTLYRGLDCWLFFAFPRASVRFSSFEYAKDSILGHCGGVALAPSQAFAAGLVAGFLESSLVITPMSTIQVKMVDDMNSCKPKMKGFFHGVRQIIAQDGIQGLYQGYGPVLVRGMSNQAIRFCLYGEIKKLLQAGDETRRLNVAETMVAGGLAGCCSVAVNQPADVVRTNMQGLHASRFTSSLNCASVILKQQGIKGLYKGAIPRVTRVFIEVGIVFTLFERIDAQLDRLVGDS